MRMRSCVMVADARMPARHTRHFQTVNRPGVQTYAPIRSAAEASMAGNDGSLSERRFSGDSCV